MQARTLVFSAVTGMAITTTSALVGYFIAGVTGELIAEIISYPFCFIAGLWIGYHAYERR